MSDGLKLLEQWNRKYYRFSIANNGHIQPGDGIGVKLQAGGRQVAVSKEMFREWYKAHMKEDQEKEVRESIFPEVKMPLIADGHEFVFSIMFGQGSAATAFTKKAWRDYRKKQIANYREKYGKK